MVRSRKEATERRRHRQKRRLIKLSLGVCACVIVAAGGVGMYTLFHSDPSSSSSEVLESQASTDPTSPATTNPATTKPEAVISPSPETAHEEDQKSPIPSLAAPTPGAVPQPTPKAGVGSFERLENDPNAVTMSFVGDVIFASTVEKILKQNGYDYPYKEVLSSLQKPDITIANLESPITERGDAQEKEYTYRSSPKALPAFKEAGFDVVTIANNHIMDYGVDGFLDTLKALDQAGIKRTGGGKNIEEAFQPAIVETKGMKIAFLGFSRKVPDSSWKAGKNKPGTADTYDYKMPLESIRKAKQEADFVVVLPHWGEERHDRPESYQKDLAKRYMDAGADLIIGSHPHVLQGFEYYQNKWVAYSMGNFLFTTNQVKDTWETVILQAACVKEKGCSLQAIPVWNQMAKPIQMDAADSKKLWQRLSSISYGAIVDDKDGYIRPAGAKAP